MNIYDKLLELKEVKTVNYSKYGIIVNEEILIPKFWLITDNWIEYIRKELIEYEIQNKRHNMADKISLEL